MKKQLWANIWINIKCFFSSLGVQLWECAGIQRLECFGECSRLSCRGRRSILSARNHVYHKRLCNFIICLLFNSQHVFSFFYFSPYRTLLHLLSCVAVLSLSLLGLFFTFSFSFFTSPKMRRCTPATTVLLGILLHHRPTLAQKLHLKQNSFCTFPSWKMSLPSLSSPVQSCHQRCLLWSGRISPQAHPRSPWVHAM